MVNAGLEGFVRAVALEMPRKIRINAVSPPWVKETMVKFGMDPAPGLAAATVAKAYVAAVEGSHQGNLSSLGNWAGLVGRPDEAQLNPVAPRTGFHLTTDLSQHCASCRTLTRIKAAHLRPCTLGIP